MKYILILLMLLVLTGAMVKTPTYYQSEWVAIQAGELKVFEHNLNQIPSFTEIYIAARVANVLGEYGVAYPYHDAPVICLNIQTITGAQIIVKNMCDSQEIIRVGAVLYP